MKGKILLTTLAALGALSLAAPSWGDHPSESQVAVDEVRRELAAMEEILHDLPDHRLRHRLGRHLEGAGSALDEVQWSLDRGDRRGPRDRVARTISYEEALIVVQRETFESGKLDAIQRLARTGRFTTEEVRSLVSQCSFESTRREALVALYPAVTDPYRYELAFDALGWHSSRRYVRETIGI